MNDQAKRVVEIVDVGSSMPVHQPSETAALVHIIERAARDPSVDIEKVERLLAAHERVVARHAKTSFAASFARMQIELPIIQERGEIKIGSGKPQRYALWEDINEQIKPVLAKHGFALSFRTGRDGDKIVVTGILGHCDGHSEETTMHLPLDASGSKNAVQAVGSSTSYGKRYTAAALLNLTSRGEDDDGRASGAGQLISTEQVEKIQSLIVDVAADIPRFCKYMGVGRIDEIQAKQFDRAISALEAKRVKEK